MITRRTMLMGMSSLLVAPAIVRKASLDFIPRHRYFAYEEIGTGIYDVVRGDGQVIGWLTPHDLKLLPDRSLNTLLATATEGTNTNNLKFFPSRTCYGYQETHEPPVSLRRLKHL